MASSAPQKYATVRESIYQAISSIRLIDPHTHINPHDPGSHTLADILGYHYYTELVHSAGMARQEIEQPGISPKELVGRMVNGLGNITNTANHHWLIDICREFFDFTDDAITVDNWEALFDTAEAKMKSPAWPQMVLDQSNVESVFLTNDFDDALEGFDTNTYIPCLRTDDLVFHLAKPAVRTRLEACSGIAMDGSLLALESALRQRFEHFVAHGVRACAISIPPSFEPSVVSDGRAQTALDHVLQHGTSSDQSHVSALSRRVFWTLAQLCDEFGLPFDLMIGVNRGVYPSGVYQGQDLYDSRVSLIQYGELFNTFPNVKFPISVLASVTNQELVSYSWIFPNVLTNGHWWYSNTPSFIHRDAAARLEAVPRNKQIGYYSDAYKLEFVMPKFGMYRRILARILAEDFVGENGWSEEKAIELGRQVLRGNVDEVFPSPLAELAKSEPEASESPLGLAASDAGSQTETPLVITTAESTSELLTEEDIEVEQTDPKQSSLFDPDETIEEIPPVLVDDQDSPTDSPTDSVGGIAAVAAGIAGVAGGIGAVTGIDALAKSGEESDSTRADNQEVAPPEPAETVVESPLATLDETQNESVWSSADDLLVTEASSEEPSELAAFLASEGDDEDGGATVADDSDGTVGEETLGPGLGTVADLNETVIETLDGGLPLGGKEVDPLPTEDEVAQVGVADVTLDDVTLDIDPMKEDWTALDAEIEALPLNVGELLGERNPDEPPPFSAESPIQRLTGDGEFTPESDSVILETDPSTGELQFPMSQLDDTDEQDPPIQVKPIEVTPPAELPVEAAVEPTVEPTPPIEAAAPVEDPTPSKDDVEGDDGFGAGIF